MKGVSLWSKIMGQECKLFSTGHACDIQPGYFKAASSFWQQTLRKATEIRGVSARFESYNPVTFQEEDSHITGTVNDYYCHDAFYYHCLETTALCTGKTPHIHCERRALSCYLTSHTETALCHHCLVFKTGIFVAAVQHNLCEKRDTEYN